MNGLTTEIQKLDPGTLYLHQQLAHGVYGDTKYIIDQPLPTPGIVVIIEKERFFFPFARMVDQVFEFRAARVK